MLPGKIINLYTPVTVNFDSFMHIICLEVNVYNLLCVSSQVLQPLWFHIKGWVMKRPF